MRDGTTLFADVYRPAGDGPWPVLLMRTPYDKAQPNEGTYHHPTWFAQQGYLVVVQDVRGRYTSEGEWYPYRHESNDGFDTVEWAATLPGSNGRVGMYGYSYVGATQMLAAVTRPPHLVAIAPALTASDYYQGWTYEGGALSQAFIQSWGFGLAEDTARRMGREDLLEDLHMMYFNLPAIYDRLPLTEPPFEGLREVAPYFFDWLEHDTLDDYWKQWTLHTRYEQVTVPTLQIGGWYDVFLEGSLQNHEGLRARAGSEAARAEQRLIVGPWHHETWASFAGGMEFGHHAGGVANEEMLRWYGYLLRGEVNGVAEEPPVRIFVMGENRWRLEDEWPLRRARDTAFYFHSQGGATTAHGDGTLSRQAPSAEEPPDAFVHAPGYPVPSVGGHSCCAELVAPMGGYDQRRVEARHDVLCYTSEPLGEDLEVTGWVSCRLWAAADAEDADWCVKLVDVHPDGTAINLTDGVVRASYRESLERRSSIVPGEVYAYAVKMRATSNVFKAGHRIRVDVSSSNFPMYDRNPGNGKPPREARLADLAPRLHTVFHDGSRASHVVLPVVGAG
jgi:putative CocE/NonD family hydrolase